MVSLSMRIAGALAKSGGKISLANYIHGMVVTNSPSDPDHGLEITAGECTDATGEKLVNPIPFRKQMNLSFASGNGNGGLAEGVAFPENGVIYTFLITDNLTGAIDFYGDTSAEGANVPVGWTVRRRLCQGRPTDGSANFIRTISNGLNDRIWVSKFTHSMDINLTSLNATLTPYSVVAPSNVTAFFTITLYIGSGSCYAYVGSLDEGDPVITSLAGSQNYDLYVETGGESNATSKFINVNSNRQVGIKRGPSNPNFMTLATIGWWEIR